MEKRLHVTIPPWVDGCRVHFRMDIGATIHRDMPDIVRRRAAETHLATLPSDAVWIWSDGSETEGVSAGGSGALIVLPTGVEQELRAPAGGLCSSTRAELVALRVAEVGDAAGTDPGRTAGGHPYRLTGSAGHNGGRRRSADHGARRRYVAATETGRHIHLQWVPAHCSLPGNEKADVLAKETSRMS